MFSALKRWFGLAETEIEHVLSDFHSAIARLESVATRKRAKADDLTQESADLKAKAAEKAKAALVASNDAAKALAVSANIAAIVAPAI